VILPTRHTFVKPPEIIPFHELKSPVSPSSPSSNTSEPYDDEGPNANGDAKENWFMKTIDEIRENHGPNVIHVLDSGNEDVSFNETVALYAAASVS
jgi:hypothetical protein